MGRLQRVMCVEDDPDIRTILEFSLHRIGGYKVCMCTSGVEAIEIASEFSPQLVLLDVMMPGLSGPQTMVELTRLEVMSRVPIVFLTAKARREEVEALLECGAAGVIVKPFDPLSLPRDICMYWEHGQRA
jgi:DNA-binding response OmpR family regulator